MFSSGGESSNSILAKLPGLRRDLPICKDLWRVTNKIQFFAFPFLAKMTGQVVSFFGSSHVSVKIVEAKSSSDIYFRLRTARLDSMLFLAAGRTDYCLLVLDAGRLKVHINLGAGETEIGSEAPFLLNDMAWHTINVTRRGSALTMQVDQHVTRGNLPSRFHELNIHFGVWLGGLATFNEIFLGNLPSFRGCMADVTYNGEDLLAKSISHPALAQSAGITWNCSDEFDATAGDPFSLTSTNSYLITRLALPRGGTTFSLSLSPSPDLVDGLILYASGLSSRPDYLGLEVRRGNVRLVAEMGGGPLQIVSTTNISLISTPWVRITVQVSPYSITLRVGNENVESLAAEGGARGASSRHLDVSELLYIGVEESRKVKLRGQGLIDTSFRVGELEIMRVIPLQVAEGDSTLITPRHLAVTLDLAKFGIRESGVLFRIRNGPEEGRIEVTKGGGGGGGKDAFSLLDLGAGRVRYWHNGQESSRDGVELVLQLLPNAGFLLPAYLQGTKVRLSADVVSSLDPDTPPEELTFTLISTGAERGGHLELDSAVGKAIRNFTQGDLLSNRVWYQDGGGSSSKLALRVTDGSSTSGTAVLRVETFPLRIAPEINTGLDVASVSGTAVPISAANLSFTSNAGDQGLVLEYHVVSAPKAGALQLRRSNGQWSGTDTFTQAHLMAGRLRFLLQRASDRGSEDEFSFHVALAETKMPTEFRFRFRILPLKLIPSSLVEIITLNETSSAPVRLQFTTTPLSLPNTAISYTLVTPPTLGYITPPPGSPVSGRPIQFWTQADGLEGRVVYSFKWTPYSALNDAFTYNVTATHLDSSVTEGPFKCEIAHITRRKPAGLSIKPLIVQEGGRESLSSKILRIRIASESETLYFNLTTSPLHGRLERAPLPGTPTTTPTLLTALSTFTSSDLDRGRLFYTHDGSESPRDKVSLVAWSATPPALLALSLDIIVKGVNNHPPALSPTASHLLHITSGGSRVLTPAVLDYLDGDWDGERAGLQYTSKGATPPGIGQLYSVSSRAPVFSWTQADIDGGRLIWRQDGVSVTQGRLSYWVTDGKFVINESLEIRSGPPWVKLGKSSTLIARRGANTPLTPDSIRIETNVDIEMSEIEVRVADGPSNGQLLVGGSPRSEFSLGEMSTGDVVYVTTGGADGGGGDMHMGRDTFHFQVDVGGAEANGQVDVAIYPQVYWAPLVVGANRSVTVGENSSAIISQNFLHITNPHIPPADIVYTLVRQPVHGYLAIDPSPSHEDSEDLSPVVMWDQTTLNEGRLRYVHSTPNTFTDSMTFTVTNGVSSLPALTLAFTVIPGTLWLTSAKPISLLEGSSVLLNATHIQARAPFFRGKLVELRILELPGHGKLGLLPRPELPLPTSPLPYSTLAEGTALQYTHDGSETQEDAFTVSAVAVVGGTRYVPVVVNNTGGWVWQGDAMKLTNAELAATDADTKEGQLMFYVVGSRGGFPALTSRPDDPITNFTQAQLNASLILFTHKGVDLKQAAFDFEVSDGLNEAGKETFKVVVRKPNLTMVDGQAPLPVFPFTRAPLTGKNVHVTSSDGKEVHFQVSSLPNFGSIMLDMGHGHYAEVSVFSQANISSGSVLYEHSKSGGDKDRIRLIASSKYADPLPNIWLDVDISVSGAAVGGLDRYVGVVGVEVKEGGAVPITERNLNLSAVEEFIAAQHSGNVWAGGLPSLRLQVTEVPRHGWLVESEETRLRPGAPLLPPLLATSGYLSYLHDDSESTSDAVTFSLWLVMSNSTSLTTSPSSTFLLNVTLPIVVTPINDQPPALVPSKAVPLPVVQAHWRKLTRADLLVSDPDTPSSQLTYKIVRLSHGKVTILPPGPNTLSPSIPPPDSELLNNLPNAERFTQADIDAGCVILLHSGPLSPVLLSVEVTDGEHGPLVAFLSIPVQPLTVTPLSPPSLRVLQGALTAAMAPTHFPLHTNGLVDGLVYNVTRPPLHGKVLLVGAARPVLTFTHHQLATGDLSYHVTDISVTNDSFEIAAYFPTSFDSPPILSSRSRPSTAHFLLPVVAVPLIKRVLEVRSFVHGFAVGGLIAPDTFSVSPDHSTTLSLALLDASPLAGVTGSNPVYELLLPPKHGRLVKIQEPRNSAGGGGGGSRPAGRWSHDDVRRGLLLYIPHGGGNIASNEIFPRISGGAEWDEFLFKLIAPGVQPALGIAKFPLRTPFFVDPDKGHTEIISDGSTDPATKRSGSGGRMRDITYLVTPHLTRDSLVLIGLIIAGVMSLSLVVVLGIRCTCSKKNKPRGQNGAGRQNGGNSGSAVNGSSGKNGGGGIIDAFAHPDPSMDCDESAGLRPLMMSTLSPRNKVSLSRGGGGPGSDTGSWTSSNLRNDTPTPSLPQCRVTPLCATAHDNHSHHQHPTPICDTFGILEIEPHPEQYGFSYGNLPPPLDLPQEMAFSTLHPSNCSTMTRSTNTPSLLPPTAGGTLRKHHPPKNQYWV
ncbi:Chondroitin sulfate proteoglycan 4 [Folsomia candida]|uniref:Chondroitin sulfate proteoglycan 4 n=1 Tax=Folsomia candida TaxID=158441 RepID=A0A226D265_FOLCA|nr:Chondroitin sulfate proteoglycan 4 [Folsomia candida]